MKLLNRIALLFVTAGLAACATVNIELPAVTAEPTTVRLPGKIIWHDLLTNDIEASQRFYAGLFGWEFEELPLTLGMGQSSKYLLIRQAGRLIGGMVDVSGVSEVNNSQWVALMSVDDVDQAVESIRQNGGKIFTPPTDLNERGRIAIVADDVGAIFAVLETRNGDPLDSEPGTGEFMWDEVWVPDVAAAGSFYQSIAPFEPITRQMQDEAYTGLAVEGVPRVGVLQNPLAEDGLAPTWVSYIKVADMTALGKVAELGGRVLLDASDRPIGGQMAIVAGPSGAGVALQTWENDE
jgi:predicted enzyme related to lactoylglutathione lyase